MIKPIPFFDLSPPSTDDDAGDVMKWMISVMDRDDKALHFVASVLSQFLKNGGLSEKQAAAIEKRYAIVLDHFERGVLHLQNGGVPSGEGPTNITHISARKVPA